jgi:cytochrome c oxidase subunit 4
MSAHTSSPLKNYFGIWLTLLVCTGLTVWAAFLDLGRFNAAVALTIATFKAILVALFFMHLKGASEKLTQLVVVASLFFLLLLLVLSMTDFATRTWS